MRNLPRISRWSAIAVVMLCCCFATAPQLAPSHADANGPPQSGPTEKQTLAWLHDHMDHFNWRHSGSHSGSYSESVKSVKVVAGKILIRITFFLLRSPSKTKTLGSNSLFLKGFSRGVISISCPLADLYAPLSTRPVSNFGSYRCKYTPSFIPVRYADFFGGIFWKFYTFPQGGLPTTIVSLRSHKPVIAEKLRWMSEVLADLLSNSTNQYIKHVAYSYNDRDLGELGYQCLLNIAWCSDGQFRALVQNHSPKLEYKSEVGIPIKSAKWARRFAEAINRLIELHGGGYKQNLFK